MAETAICTKEQMEAWLEARKRRGEIAEWEEFAGFYYYWQGDQVREWPTPEDLRRIKAEVARRRGAHAESD